MTRRIMRGMTSVAFLVIVGAASLGCSPSDPESDGGSCVPAIYYKGVEYVFAGSPDGEVAVGKRLGFATEGQCADGNDEQSAQSEVPVLAVPGVPIEQGIALPSEIDDRGILYRAASEPQGGWDPDLRRLL